MPRHPGKPGTAADPGYGNRAPQVLDTTSAFACVSNLSPTTPWAAMRVQLVLSVRRGSAMTALTTMVMPVHRQAWSFAQTLTRAFFHIVHNGFALLGIAVASLALVILAHPDVLPTAETKLRDWLVARQVEAAGIQPELTATERATASDPKHLTKNQAAVAFWLSKKYRVAPEPVSALVAEAYELSKRTKLDPTLMLAVMAVESGFNPFAQSPVGAQGLMQVMTSVHTDKYTHFGGKYAAFDPVSNLRVGVKVLQECINRAGSLEGGLKQYVGATGPDDGGYGQKVLAEQQRLQLVAQGRAVPIYVTPATPAPMAPVGKTVVLKVPESEQPSQDDKLALLGANL